MADYPPTRYDLSPMTVIAVAFVVSSLTIAFWKGVGVILIAFSAWDGCYFAMGFKAFFGVRHYC